MAPVWNMAFIPSESVKSSLSLVFISLYSFSTIPSSSSPRLSLPHSERFGHSESTFFNRQNQWRNSPLVETRSVELDWCPQDEAIHSRKMTPIFIQANKNFTSGHHTHTNTCMSLYLHLCASKPFKWTLYSRYNNCSYLWFDRQEHRNTQTGMILYSEKPKMQQLNIYSRVVTTLKHWLDWHHWNTHNRSKEGFGEAVRRCKTSTSWLRSNSALQTFTSLCLNLVDEVRRHTVSKIDALSKSILPPSFFLWHNNITVPYASVFHASQYCSHLSY